MKVCSNKNENAPRSKICRSLYASSLAQLYDSYQCTPRKSTQLFEYHSVASCASKRVIMRVGCCAAPEGPTI